MGVHVDHEGHGLGAGLLVDVITRMLDLSADIVCPGLLIHAESDQARDFSLHLIPELLPSPIDALHLVLVMKNARCTLLGR